MKVFILGNMRVTIVQMYVHNFKVISLSNLKRAQKSSKDKETSRDVRTYVRTKVSYVRYVCT